MGQDSRSIPLRFLTKTLKSAQVSSPCQSLCNLDLRDKTSSSNLTSAKPTKTAKYQMIDRTVLRPSGQTRANVFTPRFDVTQSAGSGCQAHTSSGYAELALALPFSLEAGGGASGAKTMPKSERCSVQQKPLGLGWKEQGRCKIWSARGLGGQSAHRLAAWPVSASDPTTATAAFRSALCLCSRSTPGSLLSSLLAVLPPGCLHAFQGASLPRSPGPPWPGCTCFWSRSYCPPFPPLLFLPGPRMGIVVIDELKTTQTVLLTRFLN